MDSLTYNTFKGCYPKLVRQTALPRWGAVYKHCPWVLSIRQRGYANNEDILEILNLHNVKDIKMLNGSVEDIFLKSRINTTIIYFHSYDIAHEKLNKVTKIIDEISKLEIYLHNGFDKNLFECVYVGTHDSPHSNFSQNKKIAISEWLNKKKYKAITKFNFGEIYFANKKEALEFKMVWGV